MKILYAVQATGNGHVSRAIEMVPYLQNYGEVDIFLSGNNCNLQMNGNVKYRSKGLSLFYSGKGGLHYRRILTDIAPLRILKEVKNLPVEKYDLVLNDFESITAMACAYKKIPSIQVGHQASFMSDYTPRPTNKNIIGEWILKNYARASKYVGFHFDCYDDFILPPVIKKEIWNADPKKLGHITVYLLSFSDEVIYRKLSPLKDFKFEVFSKEISQKTQKGNITFVPVDRRLFNKSLIDCTAIITGAGFETPAEALYLNKKIMAIPVIGQYEQLCNASALQQFNVVCINNFEQEFDIAFPLWIADHSQLKVIYTKDTRAIVGSMMQMALHQKETSSCEFGELLWE